MFKIFKTKDLKNQSIALLGLGQENQAFLVWLIKHQFPGQITVCDQKTKKLLLNNQIWQKYKKKINWQLGKNHTKNLNKFNFLFRSPGWPLNCPAILKAKKQKVIISSPLQAFLEQSPTKNIIGITGSKGKGTTASLIYAILQNNKKKVFLGGNIGIAPFSFLVKIKKTDYLVLELSSFQLEALTISPKLAVITNFFSDHLKAADPLNPNFHASLSKYWQAKLNIAKHKDNKYLIANQNLKTKLKSEQLAGKLIYFSPSQLTSELKGKYNQENIGAAVALAKVLKIKENIIKQTVLNFKNLEHRLELVAKKNKVSYFNNSFATNPDSTILDLKSFNCPIIQIAGGADKGANFKKLAKEIKKQVKSLILLPGQASPRLKTELIKINYPKNKLKQANSMLAAVKLAKQLSQSGDIVLLSTACASFGIFKNYKDRGDQFKKYVKNN